MKVTLHKSNTRGHAIHGWLDTYHTFSFAEYYNPERIHFGVLRVLNDDIIAPGMGFGTHPHDNMEIITIPLHGDLEHKDSMGHTEVIRYGDVQVMSAGTGITHSEYNHNLNKKVQLLQIWVFPNKRNLKPRYQQKTFNEEERINKFQLIVSPDSEGECLWIHQDSWFHLTNLGKGTELEYKIKKQGNGVYAFVIEGVVTINNQALETRDGCGFSETDVLNMKAESDCKLLLMEIPMVN